MNRLTLLRAQHTFFPMRLLLAGLLILTLPAAALAQAKGQVLSIGFDNRYRPDCWTPMLVELTSGSQDATEYQIQIQQEDLDRDRVIFTQQVTLGGNVEGQPPTSEKFWLYFRPKPTGGGLPDMFNNGTLYDLSSKLKVFLCNKDGSKQLSVLPLTATIENVDPTRSQQDNTRSRKLILFITDGNDRPIIPDYSHLRGVMEDVEYVTLKPQDLPNNVIGYDAVDAIVWMDADARALVSGTRTPTIEAIEQWVQQGGDLLVTEPSDSLKIKPFADLLPVGGAVNGEWAIPMVDRPDVDILRRLSKTDLTTTPWNITGTFKVGRAPAVAGAKVDEWMQWQDNGVIYFSPWLARRGIGLGAVTWVAQDLGNPALTDSAKTGWRYIWDRVFDWHNSQDLSDDAPPPTDGNDKWQPAAGLDLGSPLNGGMDLTNTAAAKVSIACIFFFLYFLIAGPGVYLFLASRKKSYLSWYYFGLSAIVATGLTALLVKAVVRGPPKLQHISFVRYAAGDADEIIQSRFGLYIPQDGDKQIDLLDTDPNQVSFIAPYGKPPQYVEDDDSFPAYLEYHIPVRDAGNPAPVSVTIPYRSTSKKFQVQWFGDPKIKIQPPPGDDDIKLAPPANDGGYLDGTLENDTGMDLRDVYLIFKSSYDTSAESSQDTTMMIYLPTWKKDEQWVLKDLIKREDILSDLNKSAPHLPGGKFPGYGPVGNGMIWNDFWQTQQDKLSHDLDQSLPESLPMLTAFDEINPWGYDGNTNRFELYRRSVRQLNLSPAISAGELVICGLADVDDDITKTPLPIPLNVSDSPVTGDGTTVVQFVLPLNRNGVVHAPATRPAPQQPPATQPAGGA